MSYSTWEDNRPDGANDPFYTSADLKIAVLPANAQIPLQVDGAVSLQLGKKLMIDIASAQFSSPATGAANPKSKIQNPQI